MMETSVQVMFWVLFARDNVDKPQSEVHSAVAAAKIEQNLNSLVLNLFQLLFLLFLFQLRSLHLSPKYTRTERHYKNTSRTTCTVETRRRGREGEVRSVVLKEQMLAAVPKTTKS